MNENPRSKTEVSLVVIISFLIVVLLLCGGIFLFGPFNQRAVHSRTDAEIAALTAALESYKITHGDYPKDSASARLSPSTHIFPPDYIPASHLLYRSLSGSGGGRVYFEFSPAMLATNAAGRVYIVDVFRQSYGYSYDGKGFPRVWSTAGDTKGSATNHWISN